MPPNSQLPTSNSAAGGRGDLVVANGRPAAVVAFESGLVDFFVDAAELLGVPKSVAAIYGVVFASPVPLSFADIEARLDLSRGSVSQGLRVLREVGALKEVSKPEDRAELFVPDTELRRLVLRFVEQRVQGQLEAGGERLARLRKAAAGLPEQKALTQRLMKLQQWQERTRALLPVVKTFLKLGGASRG